MAPSGGRPANRPRPTPARFELRGPDPLGAPLAHGAPARFRTRLSSIGSSNGLRRTASQRASFGGVGGSAAGVQRDALRPRHRFLLHARVRHEARKQALLVRLPPVEDAALDEDFGRDRRAGDLHQRVDLGVRIPDAEVARRDAGARWPVTGALRVEVERRPVAGRDRGGLRRAGNGDAAGPRGRRADATCGQHGLLQRHHRVVAWLVIIVVAYQMQGAVRHQKAHLPPGAMPGSDWTAPAASRGAVDPRRPAPVSCAAPDQARGGSFARVAISTLLFDQPAHIAFAHAFQSAGQTLCQVRRHVARVGHFQEVHVPLRS